MTTTACVSDSIFTKFPPPVISTYRANVHDDLPWYPLVRGGAGDVWVSVKPTWFVTGELLNYGVRVDYYRSKAHLRGLHRLILPDCFQGYLALQKC